MAAFLGGLLIGVSSIFLLLSNGRILGISGIVNGLFNAKDKQWRVFFLTGLILTGLFLFSRYPDNFINSVPRSYGVLFLAGLLVGYGTTMANGCTSGHGVCGISRLSMRSIVATLTFISFGALTVFIMNHFLGGKS